MYDFAVGHWPADLLLTDVVLLPPTIGPTLGTSFVSQALGHPLQRGGFMCTQPTTVYREKGTNYDVDDVIFIDWTGVWSMKTLNCGSKGSTIMNIQLSNDYDT